MTLEKLYSIIQQRIKLQPKGSYVASLYKQGEDRILQKIGEEATEVIISAKGKNKRKITEEVADLYFMTLILLVVKEIRIKKVLGELEKRRSE
jgi:phosphoribosyl-ATP pyrophosphohydrolase